MQITKKNSKDEKRIITAMIVDDFVCGKISAKWGNKGLFRTKWGNTIASWCVWYFSKYEKAPQKHIVNLYEKWASRNKDPEAIKLVEKFLDTLSTDYAKLKQNINANYVLDIAGDYFNAVKLKELSRTIDNEIDLGNTKDANEIVVSYNTIELGKGEGINALEDTNAIKEAFESKKEPLIKYPGALGKFFGDALERDAFIAIMAPEKRGKTWLLLDVAVRGVIQKKKVAFFEAGDMSQNQFMRRLITRISNKPMKRCLVDYPTSISMSIEGDIDVGTKRLRFKKGLQHKEAQQLINNFTKKLNSDGPLLKLSCHPNSTLSTTTIQNTLKLWERDSWVPDVIVIDYMDILDKTYRGLEGRDCINEAWKQMRGLSQKYHCLIVTATQADAESYNSGILKRSNFSEDKRKFAHVTGMLGLNQKPSEKEQGIMRWNWIVLRESDFDERDCVHVATCLELGRPAVLSYYK